MTVHCFNSIKLLYYYHLSWGNAPSRNLRLIYSFLKSKFLYKGYNSRHLLSWNFNLKMEFYRYSSRRGAAVKTSRRSTAKWWRTSSSWRWTTSRTSSSSRGPSSPRPEILASANVRWPPRLKSASSGCSTG